MRNLLRTSLRILFAIIFITTAMGKLLDNRGFSDVLRTYELFPASVTLPLALGISLAELYFGCALAFGRGMVRCATFTVAMNFGYGALSALSLWRGLKLANCGCFGVFFARPLTGYTLVEDGVLIILSMLFFASVNSPPEVME